MDILSITQLGIHAGCYMAEAVQRLLSLYGYPDIETLRQIMDFLETHTHLMENHG